VPGRTHLRASRPGCRLLATGEVAVRVWLLRIVPVLPALILCACARDPFVTQAGAVRSGDWRIERQADRVTGKPISSALLVTRKGSSASALYPQVASLQLSCFVDHPVIKFSFESKVGTNLNSFLGYRFDEKPGHEIGARFVADSSAVVIEDQAEVAQFVRELATSSVLYVRTRSLNADRTSAEFNVDGAPAAIDAAFAGCPVTEPAPQPQRPMPRSRRRSV
jgi:hypothetical protein